MHYATVSKAYLPFLLCVGNSKEYKEACNMHVPKYLAGHFCKSRAEK